MSDTVIIDGVLSDQNIPNRNRNKYTCIIKNLERITTKENFTFAEDLIVEYQRIPLELRALGTLENDKVKEMTVTGCGVIKQD